MPNHFVFDKSSRPVYTNLTNTYKSPGTVALPETGAGAAGNLYAASATNSATFALGGTVAITLQVANPAGSGKTLYVSRIAGGVTVALNLLSSFTGTLTLTKAGTLTSPTTLTPVNSNFASTNTSVMTVHSSTSAPTGGTAFFSIPLQAGPFLYDEAGGYVVPPGQTITMSVSGSLSVAGVVGTTADLVWWEA
ncbi:hypothetical protein ACM1RC_18950 [Paenibacillus azoreducens]|uniref:hypothetical protein n=1 Tax=Paenibacillus azoreducens TaxID=116718 RepID=UPI0039F50B37